MLFGMPGTFVLPEHVRLELIEGTPFVRLLVAKPASAAVAEGWSLASRMTVCLVDGGPDIGYMFPRIGLDAPDGWDDAVDQIGGSFVVFGNGTGRDIFARAI